MPFTSTIVNAVYVKRCFGRLDVEDVDRFQREFDEAQRRLKRPLAYVALMDEGRAPVPAAVPRLLAVAEHHRDNLDSGHIVFSRPGLIASVLRASIARMMLLSPSFAQKFAVRASLEDALLSCTPKLHLDVLSTADEIRRRFGLA